MSRKTKIIIMASIVTLAIVLMIMAAVQNNVFNFAENYMNQMQEIEEGTAEAAVIEHYSSSLIETYNYIGSNQTPCDVGTVLENGARMYNDTSETFESVPYKYQNAEYFIIPNSDKSIVSDNLLDFVPFRDLDVLIFRDSNLSNPSWMQSGFTKTKDIVTGTNGIIYDVYRKSVKAGEHTKIGGNGETAEDGSKGWMNIIAVKQTGKIDSEIFFDEHFTANDVVNSSVEEIKYKSSIAGWNLVTTGTGVTLEAQELNGEHTAHFVDTNTSAMGYIYKKFATTEHKIKATFKVNVTKITGTNKYIRLFLNNGIPPANVSDLAKVLNEMYLNNTELVSKSELSGNKELSIKKGITNNEWHTITVNLDIDNTTYTVSVDGQDIETVYKLRTNANLSANNILIASGNAHENDVYLSQVEIVPQKNTAILGIMLNGVPISNFNQFTKAYKESVREDNNEITIEKGPTYKSHTITTSEEGNYQDITVVDTNDISYSYRVYLDNQLANKTELRSIVSEIDGMNSDYYTTESWNNLITVKNQANKELNNTNASLIDLDSYIENLRLAIKNLIMK